MTCSSSLVPRRSRNETVAWVKIFPFCLVGDRINIQFVEHQAVDLELLVHAAEHDFFVDRLVFATDKVTVEVNVEIVHLLYQSHGITYKEVVYVERMLGELHAAVTRKLGAESCRMHQKI